MAAFLDLPDAEAETADVLLLPLPFEATVSYGQGTAEGPQAIWQASTHIELWDEEIAFNLDVICFHSATAVAPLEDEAPQVYLDRVERAAAELHGHGGLVFGVGGEHSLTPPLVRAAVDDAEDLSRVTVVQFDAHSDLRDSYSGTPCSHACAMRRLVERGAKVIAIGIRSAEGAEYQYGRETGRVETYFAHELARKPEVDRQLLSALGRLDGDVYLTFDVDGLDVGLSPGTGTPQPGGLGWWQALRYLRTLVAENRQKRLLGCDVVETVPQPGTRVNELTSARLICKVVAYHYTHRRQRRTAVS